MKEYREISSSDRMSNIKDEPSLYHHVSKSIELKKIKRMVKSSFTVFDPDRCVQLISQMKL